MKRLLFLFAQHLANDLTLAVFFKADIALHGNPISEVRDVTCHMGSHKCYLPPDTSERAPP